MKMHLAVLLLVVGFAGMTATVRGLQNSSQDSQKGSQVHKNNQKQKQNAVQKVREANRTHKKTKTGVKGESQNPNLK